MFTDKETTEISRVHDESTRIDDIASGSFQELLQELQKTIVRHNLNVPWPTPAAGNIIITV